MNDNTYGKTKAEIIDAAKTHWETSVWATSINGADYAGYAIGTIDLPVIKTFYRPTETLFEGGFGIADNAYTITNWNQLQNISKPIVVSNNYHFKLSNNLDNKTAGYASLASSTANSNKGWFSIGNDDYLFVGHFDGGNKTIADLYISNKDKNYKGLFGYVKDSTIKNIGVINANISGNDYVGALVGTAENSTVENSYATGTVLGQMFVGGLVGLNLRENRDAIIKNSYSTANVTGISYIGGLVGKNNAYVSNSDTAKATIENSYATGKVTGTSNVGGLVGLNQADIENGSGTSIATIKNSYATGEVSGTSSSGGLIGKNNIANYGGSSGTTTVTIIDSFFDTETTKQTAGIGGDGAAQDGVTGKTTAEMKNPTTFTGWDLQEDSTLEKVHTTFSLAKTRR